MSVVRIFVLSLVCTPVVALPAQSARATTDVSSALESARIGMSQARAEFARVDARLSRQRSTMAVLAYAEAERTPPAPWAQQDPANTVYRDAREALDQKRYADAAALFEEVYRKYPGSTYAANSYYWQAYALSRRGGSESLRKALAVLTVQGEKAPKATTRLDAVQLATRIRGQLARDGDAASAEQIAVIAGSAAAPPTPPELAMMPGAPEAPMAPRPARVGGRSTTRDRCEGEDDIQSAALNALQQMDEEKALPILKRVLARRDAGSECIRRKAVFIISQQEAAGTEQVLLSAARSDPDREVREQAVWWLSQVDTPVAVAALDSILRSATEPSLQDKALFALSQQESPKARTALRDFALRPGISEELRSKAIFWIGQSEDPENLAFLKSLWGQLKSAESRDKILFSISQIEGRESQAWLLQVAGDVNQDIEVRKKALFWVGQSDLPIAELFSLYEKMPSREMKEQLIFVYSQRDEKAAVDKMLQIAKTEPDRELRKKAIFWLSQSNDPRVAEFLAGLLEKPN